MGTSIPPSLTSGLITCIGNKRRILPDLAHAVAPLLRARGATTFLDPFSGSGAVSRLARHLDCIVHANDWEPYAAAVTAAYLENTRGELEALFARHGGVDTVYRRLNACRDPQNSYISRHYAPERTEEPRVGEERLFYTAENARFIDAVREEIERLYPGRALPHPGQREHADARLPVDEAARAKRVLISSLLHEASVAANTSGVFKAYHRGFGGLGGDALRRILRPMKLAPPYIHGTIAGTGSCGDASRFLAAHAGDICYLDPPYATHQYGSNYFMLNTIALWDRPAVDDRRDASGNLVSKAGIRPDWTATRSAYCSRRQALPALQALLAQVDARYLVMSYSTDGIVSLEQLAQMLSEQGSLEAHRVGYVTYRGGRQSLGRKVRNAEFIFVVDRRPGSRVTPVTGVRAEVDRHVMLARLAHLENRRFNPVRLRGALPVRDGSVELAPGWHAYTRDGYQLRIDPPPARTGRAEIRRAADQLETAALASHLEELAVILSLMWNRGARGYASRAVWCLKKFGYAKYGRELGEAVSMIRRAALMRPRIYGVLLEKADAVVERSRIRAQASRQATIQPRVPAGENRGRPEAASDANWTLAPGYWPSSV